MTGVARAHAARRLAPVQRQGVGADVLAPERLLEARLQRRRPRRRACPRARRSRTAGAHSAASSWPRRRSPAPRPARSALRPAPVGVEDRSCESFQPWLRQPGLRGARVLDEAVAVEVAALVDPPQRALDRRPQAAQRAPRRRCAANRGRRARRTAAWNRRSRSRGRTGISPSAAISPPRISCRILPGCASPRLDGRGLIMGEPAQHADARRAGRTTASASP